MSDVFFSKNPDPSSLDLVAFHLYASTPTLIDLEKASNIIELVGGDMHGMEVLVGIDESSWQDWTL